MIFVNLALAFSEPAPTAGPNPFLRAVMRNPLQQTFVVFCPLGQPALSLLDWITPCSQAAPSLLAASPTNPF